MMTPEFSAQGLPSALSKEVIVEALLDLMHSHREEFTAIVQEALELQEREDAALGRAINEGLSGEYVSEEDILRLLRHKAGSH